MLFIDLDLGGLIQVLNGLAPTASEEMAAAGRDLAAATYAHIVEEANKKLHTRRQMFIDGLSLFQDEGSWVVNLDAKVRWIDDGQAAHSMLEDLLKAKNAKHAKDGSVYAVIPFAHGPKGPTQMTPAQANLLATIKKELKKFDIPYAGIETHDNGKPKLGLLHSLDINTKPIKTREGPGTGRGPIGAVMQGWSADGKSGTPLLQGVKVYQHQVGNKDGSTSTKRSIMTFRVVSSKHMGTDRWQHPGLPPMNLMEEGLEWAKRQFESEIAPKVMAKLIAKLT